MYLICKHDNLSAAHRTHVKRLGMVAYVSVPALGMWGQTHPQDKACSQSSLAYLVSSRLVRVPVLKTVKVVAFKDYSPE